MKYKITALALFIVLSLLSCQQHKINPVSPGDDAQILEKKEKVTYSVKLTNGDLETIDCLGNAAGRNLTAYFEDGCLKLNSGVEIIPLSNAMINVARRKGTIANVQLWFVYGGDTYSSNQINIAGISNDPESDNFVINVQNDEVKVYKHLGPKGGKREKTETWNLRIGDMEYTIN